MFRLLPVLLLVSCGRPKCDDGCDPNDQDGDGYSAAEDCDDADPTVHPGAEEVWYDGLDQDCAADDDFDADADGWVPQGKGYDGDLPVGDCDDDQADRNPGLAEILGDDVDGDCDGEPDGVRMTRLGRATRPGPPAVTRTVSHWVLAGAAEAYEDLDGNTFEQVGYALTFEEAGGAAEPLADVVWMGSTGTDPVAEHVDVDALQHWFYAVGSYTRSGAGYLQITRVTWNGSVGGFDREITQDFRGGDPTLATRVGVHVDDDLVRAVACTDTAIQYADTLASDSFWLAQNDIDAYTTPAPGGLCTINRGADGPVVHADPGTGVVSWAVHSTAGTVTQAASQPASDVVNGVGRGGSWSALATDDGVVLIADGGGATTLLSGRIDAVDVDEGPVVAALTRQGLVLASKKQTVRIPLTVEAQAVSLTGQGDTWLLAIQTTDEDVAWGFARWSP